MQTINAKDLNTSHVQHWLRFDRGGNLDKPAKKRFCYRLTRTWADGGISVRKFGTPQIVRPLFLPSHKLNQSVEVYTADEFDKLPE